MKGVPAWLLLLAASCSWTLSRPPPAKLPADPAAPVDCNPSMTPPLLDGGLAVAAIFGMSAAIASVGTNPLCDGEPCQRDEVIAWVSLGVGLAVMIPAMVSSHHGHRSATRCRSVKWQRAVALQHLRNPAAGLRGEDCRLAEQIGTLVCDSGLRCASDARCYDPEELGTKGRPCIESVLGVRGSCRTPELTCDPRRICVPR